MSDDVNDFLEGLRSDGLPDCPIPERFDGRLRRIGTSAVGAGEFEIPPYFVRRHAEEFVDSDSLTEDYIVLANAGHGVNSWALQFHAVVNGVGVFTSSTWGGIVDETTDERERASDIERRFGQIERLLTWAAAANECAATGERMAVLSSPTDGEYIARWNVADGEPAWSRSPNALEEALTLLDA